MLRSASNGIAVSMFLVFGIAALAVAASPGDVVINEIYPNAPTYFDGSEFIEIYNTTGSAIDIGGWMLTGTEYDGTCTGDRDHIFPSGTSIAAGGYIVIARDALNDDDDGFKDEFLDVTLDFEMVDPNSIYDQDDPTVPNMILGVGDTTAYDDQIRLIPGNSDYAASCGGSYNRFEVLLLIDDGATLIDHIEYRYSSCTSDQCPGLGTSDNDAYPAYPDEGLSLGRPDISTDTDNCANDFLWEAPTPGEQNVNGIPPNIWSLGYSPCVPGPADPVTIDCYVDENGDGVKWVKCIYKQGGAAWDTVAMMQDVVVDSLYTVDLPARPHETQSLFYIWASDTMDVTGIYPADARDDPYHYSVGLTAISEIQQVDIGDDSSYVAGQVKNITGVVTAARGTYFDNMFVVQQGSGTWSGIHVYDPSYSVPAAVGDSVILSGRVQEYYNLTEFYLFTDCYTEVSSGNPVYETLVPTSEINTASIYAESWEGVLVRVDSVTVTNGDLGYGEWEINDGSGPCIVDDAAYYAYQPKTGHTIESVWGVVDYAYDFYKIQPRGDGDIVGALTLSDVRYTPHAPTTTDVVTVSAVVNTGFPIEYIYVYHNTDGGAVFDSTLMSAVDDTTYAGDIGPFPVDLTIVTYYVGVKDSSGATVRRPDGYTYDFRVGEMTIYTIQSTLAGDADSSAYAGEPVNVSGIVTSGTGDFGPYNFYLQNSYSGAETPEYRGILVYTRTDTLSIARGDSVTVSGDVGEYYNETQISMFFSEAITVHSSRNPVPEAYSQSTAAVESEQWEGVLLSVSDAVVVDPDIGFGGWWITNTGNIADTCRVGDDSWYSFEPVLGDTLNVRGIVNYVYRSYNLQPRDDDDIVGQLSIGSVRYAPHAPTTSDVVSITALVRHRSPITSVYVYHSTDLGASFDSTLMSTVDDSVYSADIGPFAPDLTIVDYYVKAADNTGLEAQKPGIGTYDFRIGMLTIYQIQSTFASDSDSSLYARDLEPANVSGIVTAGTGEYRDDIFYAQSSYSGLETPEYRGIRIWAGVETLNIQRGDSITVSGNVQEFNGETEISMSFPEAITVHLGGNSVPEAYPELSATVESEQWEGVLLAVKDAEIIDTGGGFDSWRITDTGNVIDACRVGDLGSYTFVPVLGNMVDVHGVVNCVYKSYSLQPRDDDDIHDPTWVGVDEEPDAPVSLAMAVSPNPMTRTSDVRFALPASGPASLRVYNIQGQLVETLVDGNIKAGEHSVHWDGTNNAGNRVTSGIYFFKLETGKGSVISKIVVSR